MPASFQVKLKDPSKFAVVAARIQGQSGIEKIVDKRQIKYGKSKPVTEYRVKWKGYGPEWNEWYPEDLLDNARDLIKGYLERHKS